MDLISLTGFYCAACGQLQRDEHAGQPCQRCRRRTFADLKLTHEWIVTPADRDFLRTQGIAP